MKTITKRSLAMLLFVVMLFSCCQGALVSTFAAETNSTATPDTAVTEPSEAPDSGESSSDSEIKDSSGNGYTRLEAEVSADIKLYEYAEYDYEGASNGKVVYKPQIENAFQLELFEDLGASSLKYTPYVKYNVFADTTGSYELHIGVVVENLPTYEGFYIPIVVNGKAYEATCSEFPGYDGIYEFVVTVELVAGKNAVYCTPFDAMSYLATVDNDPNAISKSSVGFDYIDIPTGLSELVKDNVAQEELIVPSLSISDPNGNGGISLYAEEGSIGGAIHPAGGEANNADTPNGYLNSAYPGVTMQVVYYRYSEVYNADKMYEQVKNSLTSYGTSTDHARNPSGTLMSSAGTKTVFDPFYITKYCYFVNTYASEWKNGTDNANYYVYQLPASDFPSGRVWNYKYTLNANVFNNSSYRVGASDSELQSFFRKIILGSSSYTWDISDVAGTSSLYAKVLRELDVNSEFITNYLNAYNGNLSLVSSVDSDGDGTKDVNELIPVIIWKSILQECKEANSDGSRPASAAIHVPADIVTNGLTNDTAKTVSWWKTAYLWDTKQVTYNGASGWHSSAYVGAYNKAGQKCSWDTYGSIACRIFFGVFHADSKANGWAHTSGNFWNNTVSNGAGLVNLFPADGWNAKTKGTNKMYYFRNYWAPFGVGSGSVTYVKKDANDSSKNLSGAKFRLYKDSECTIPVTSADYTVTPSASNNIGYSSVSVRISNAKGKFSYANLRSGVYFLKEIEAPTGYVLNSASRMISIQNTSKNGGSITNVELVKDYQITITKTSGGGTVINSSISDNSLYSLTGAKFDIYVNGVKSETVTIGSNGKATTSKKYEEGTVLTIKEVSAPKGYWLRTTDTTYTVTSSASVSISNNPVFDPATLKFYKIDKKTGKPHGNSSFEGAIFRWEFYDDEHWSGTPLRTWYFRSNSSGYVIYGTDCLVDTATYPSDELYTSTTGTPRLPLGYLKVTEVVAPAGYGVLPSLYGSVTQTANGAAAEFNWDDREIVVSTGEDGTDLYSCDIVKKKDGNYAMEEAEGILAAFSVRKIDKALWEKNAKQGDITSLRAQFRVINLSTNPVKIGDFDVADTNEVCFTFWTSSSGYYQSEALFPVGKYRIEEVTAPTGMTLNSSWYKEFEVKSTTTDGYVFNFSSTVEKSCPNVPIHGGFSVYKVDNDRYDSEHSNNKNPQGGASFVGTQFVVYNRSTNPVVVNGTTYAVDEICYSFTMTTESGVYTSASNVLPYGTYEIKESVAGPGYDVNEDWSATFSIRKNGVIVEANSRTNNPLEEPIHRGDLLVIKLDQETMHSYGQGDATLAGAIVQVVNNNTYAVYTDRDGNGNYAWYSKGQVCLYITFNENGQASTVGKEAYKEKKALPYGSYTVSEYAPSEGYKINSTWSKTITIGATTTSVNLTPANNHLPEPIIRGGFAIYKVDKNRYELGNSSLQNPQGSATFKGTVFAVYNRSKGPVRVNGKDYAVGSVCYTFTMESASGEFKSAIDLLPYGTYEIKELTAPTGYLVNSSWSATFSIRNDGVIVEANSRTENPCDEPIIRGGVEIYKVDKSFGECRPQGDATLAGAVFQVVTNNTYGVYTDLDGDGKLEIHAKGTVCLYITTEEDGIAVSADDALPYGTYTITEVESPDGYKLASGWSVTVTISENRVLVCLDDDCVEEPLIHGGFTVYKVDEDRYDSAHSNIQNPQGGATFAGTTFEVRNMSANPVYIEETKTEYAVGAVCYTFVMDATGVYTSASDLLPYGTYQISETKAGTGYMIPTGGWSATISIREDGVIVKANNRSDNNPLKEPIIHGGVRLFKVDADTGKSVGQGEAVIAGAVIKIVNNNTYAVYTDRDGTGTKAWYSKGQVCLYLTVGSNGQAISSNDALPYGSYTAYEQEAPEGYLINSSWSAPFSVSTDGYIYTLTGTDLILRDSVIRGGVKVEKFDSLLGYDTTSSANLSGITFSVYSNNSQSVRVNGTDYNNGERVAILGLNWSNTENTWVASSSDTMLPYGTYTIKENKKSSSSDYANDYYLWSDVEYTFSVRNNKEIVEVDTSNNPIVYQNLPVGRIDLLKVNQRNVSLAGVKLCLEWSQDGDAWTPVESVAVNTFTPGGSTTQGIVDGCLVTDANGALSYTGLDPRLQYRLTEVETLNGYVLLTEPVFTGVLKANENSQWTQNYKVVNADVFKLPEVGSYDMVIIPFIFAICATVTTVALVYTKKKEEV